MQAPRRVTPTWGLFRRSPRRHGTHSSSRWRAPRRSCTCLFVDLLSNPQVVVTLLVVADTNTIKVPIVPVVQSTIQIHISLVVYLWCVCVGGGGDFNHVNFTGFTGITFCTTYDTSGTTDSRSRVVKYTEACCCRDTRVSPFLQYKIF